MLKFKQSSIDFGEVARDAVLPFEFYLESGNLLCINPGCGCTKAEYDPKKGKITGTLSVGQAITKDYSGQFSRAITAYEDDWLPFIDASDFRYKTNRKKGKQVLTLIATVV